MMLDVALVRDPSTGLHDLAWDDFGDLVFDDLGIYPVLTTIVTHKGAYYWDESGEQGTHLHTVKKDRFATGSQLRAYVQDGLDQCRAERIIDSGTVTTERLRPGSWVVRPRWVAAGHEVARELRT